MMKLTILICTHNRAALLAKVLESLQSALRPQGWDTRILVVANACSDTTHEFLESEQAFCASTASRIPTDWISEPRPGKSYALNTAIPYLADGALVTFVDDDHRVESSYLVEICKAADAYPAATMFCGRILPDWDGSEPAWVHDEGPYRIYPLPVPRQDMGPTPRTVEVNTGPLPGGGNLFLRPGVFARVGGFSTDLGPKGHDLGGGEDSAFVLHALDRGERLQYVPSVLQYHYVDSERLRFSYLLRKAYQRSRSASRIEHEGNSVPPYMWRKLGEYGLKTMLPLGWPRTRFYLMRLASTLGEIRGQRESIEQGAKPGPARPLPRVIWPLLFLGLIALGLTALASALPMSLLQQATGATLGISTTLALLLGAKSLLDYSQTGPQIRAEILSHFQTYFIYAFLRLLGLAWFLLTLQAGVGALTYSAIAYSFGVPYRSEWLALSAIAAVFIIVGLQFCRHLLMIPASLVASSHYRMSRFYGLWQQLTPARLRLVNWALFICGLLFVGHLLQVMAVAGFIQGILAVLAFSGALAVLYTWLQHDAYPQAARATSAGERLNVLMIGSDTLRADRINPVLTPCLDQLARHGSHLAECYVPCARTAPSLISLLTGTWPHRHGIRDNYSSDRESRLNVEALPTLLNRHGYATAALSDWCGGDMGKFPFGFSYVDLPEDQWNLKFFIRQGPKDLRLFLSLFTHNAFGKDFLPEIHYLGGVPLTDELGREACRLINRFATGAQPFLLNVFFSTTHPPFGSEYPYYTLYSPRDYAGESKFAMARLTDPWEIIRRQTEPRESFDVDQIMQLYDGCVRRFDDEVARILQHLDECGLAEKTLVVVYSDHGMEFFEHGTWGQGNSAVGEHSARVPIIISGPGCVAQGKVEGVTRTVDMVPTLLEMLGLPPAQGVDGQSLAGVLRGGPLPDLLALYETGIWLTTPPGMPAGHLQYPDLLELLEVPDKRSGTLAIKKEYQQAIVTAKDRMVRWGRWKLVYQPLQDGIAWSLFDLQTDPECLNDVKQSHPEVVDRLQVLLLDWVGTGPARH